MRRQLSISVVSLLALLICYLILLFAPAPDKVLADTPLNGRVYLMRRQREEIARVDIQLQHGASYSVLYHLESDGSIRPEFLNDGGKLYDDEAMKVLLFNASWVYADEWLLEDHADLSLYGLENPLAEVIITTRDGTVTQLYIGDPAPLGKGYYARTTGREEIWLLDSYTARSLSKAAMDFRYLGLLPTDIKYGDLTGLRVADPDGKTLLELERRGESIYLMAPVEGPAIVGELTSRLLEPLFSLKGAVLIEDIPKALTPYGLDSPHTLEIKIRNRADIIVLIGEAEDGQRYAMETERQAVVLCNESSLAFLQQDYHGLLEESPV